MAKRARRTSKQRQARKKRGARKKAAARVGRSRQFVPVRFTDADLIRNRIKPPFDDDEGDYEDPGVVIPGGREPANLPAKIDCPGSLVIYSSRAAFVNNCQGYKGPAGRNNDLVKDALANAQKAAAKINCKDSCTRRVAEIWRGWRCTPDGNKFFAVAAVELKIFCEITT
jgi:hypothetical protein